MFIIMLYSFSWLKLNKNPVYEKRNIRYNNVKSMQKKTDIITW